MGYRSEIYMYIACPTLEDFEKVLQSMMQQSEYNSIPLLLIAKRGQIIQNENGVYVLKYFDDWIKWYETDDEYIHDVGQDLEEDEIQFHLEFLRIGEEFEDVERFDYYNMKKENQKFRLLQDRHNIMVTRLVETDSELD